MGYAVIEGVRLRYGLRRGHGLPMLMCNGIGANFEIAAPYVAEIPDRPVLLFDVPGVGGSDRAWFWPRQAAYARFAIGLLDHLGFERAVVSGISWGGTLAQQIARDYPERTVALILMATTPGIVMVPGRLAALMRMLTPQRYLSRTFMARNAPLIYGGEMRNHPDRAIDYSAMTRAPTTLGYLQQLCAIQQFSSLLWLRRLALPTLVLCGDDDPLIRTANAHLLAALLPQARLRIIRGGGHLFMILRPREIAGLVEDFLSEVGAEKNFLRSPAPDTTRQTKGAHR